MARKNRIGLEIDMESMIKDLERSSKDVRSSTTEILQASKEVVTDALVRDTVKQNFPARGKYSTGKLAKSINKDSNVKWSGYVAEIKVGYDFSLESVMLLYGTPRMKKSTKLYNDIYGAKIRKQIAEMQEQKLAEILAR